MSRTPTIAASVALLLSVGAASVWTLPAGGETAAKAQARLDSIPLDLSPWVGENLPITEKITKDMRVAEASAFVNRLYRHAQTNQTVAISLLYGRQGEMCAHDPNTCYAGSGFDGKGTAKKDFPAANSALWITRFEKGEPAEGLEVGWGFSAADGSWAAPANPRREFALHGMLYKLYAQRSAPVGVVTPDAKNPLLDFLNVFLPKVNAALAAEK